MRRHTPTPLPTPIYPLIQAQLGRATLDDSLQKQRSSSTEHTLLASIISPQHIPRAFYLLSPLPPPWNPDPPTIRHLLDYPSTPPPSNSPVLTGGLKIHHLLKKKEELQSLAPPPFPSAAQKPQVKRYTCSTPCENLRPSLKTFQAQEKDYTVRLAQDLGLGLKSWVWFTIRI